MRTILQIGLISLSMCTALQCPALASTPNSAEVILYRHPVIPPTNISVSISFYEDRILKNPQEGLDRVVLGGLYIKKARQTGLVSLIDRADELAKKSLELLPYHNFGARLLQGKVAEERHRFQEAIQIANE